MTQTLPEEPELPPSLRLLKRLVTVLTLVMIVAVITITGLFVTRLPNFAAPPSVPEGLDLPEGTQVEAVTMGKNWIAVVTSDQHILIFSFDGKLVQDFAIEVE